MSKDKYNRTAWHKAALGNKVELLNKLSDWDKELQLKPEDLKNEVLLSKDMYKDTVWQKASK